MKHMSTAEVSLTIADDQKTATLILKPDVIVCCHNCAMDFMMDFLSQMGKRPSVDETEDLH